MGKITLIIISNQIIVRESLAGFLNGLKDFDVIADTDSHLEAVELAKRLLPELLLVDIELPKRALKEITASLADIYTSVKVLFFSSLSGKERLIEAISLNAHGYLTTDLPSQDFTRLLKEAAEGRPAISPTVLSEVLQEARDVLMKNQSQGSLPRLTRREQEVLKQLASGATNRKIADSLVISECTVKNHIHNMLDKLHIQNRTQLICYAHANGMLTLR